jgi:Sterol-sensing domain of SREBP cleavage-activation
MAQALGRCGLSVWYINALAYLLGAATTLPATRYFCLYAGIAVLFDFFVQVLAALLHVATLQALQRHRFSRSSVGMF